MRYITYPSDMHVDEATKRRTEKFFILIDAGDTSDSELAALVCEGIAVGAWDERKHTPLLLAAKKGYTDTVRALLALGADTEARSDAGETSVLVAADNGHTHIVRTLLAAGADSKAQGKDNFTALIWAACKNYTDIVRALLAVGKLDNNDGHVALMEAAIHGHTAVVQILLNAGVNMEARNDASTVLRDDGSIVLHNDGSTALIWAAKSGRIETVRALLARGANVYAQNNRGLAALDCDAVKNDSAGLSDEIAKWQKAYAEFIQTHEPPVDAKHVYQLLAVSPLADRNAPVDYEGNIRKIFLYAKWKNKAQAAGILGEMQQDGTISAETAESILAATFPPKLLHPLLARPQQDKNGASR